MIDPTCKSINTLFVVLFKNSNNDPTNDSLASIEAISRNQRL